MVNVTRFSPLDDAFDNLLRGFVLRPASLDARETAVKFRVDISEDDKAYTVHADLPGVKKDEIHIAIDGEQVTITAETRAQTQTVDEVKDTNDGKRVLRSERYAGKYYRAFTLGAEVDDTAAAARYADGVLELTLPKKAPAAAKRVTIQ